MQYSKTDFLKDFMQRTQVNLNYIEKGVNSGEKVFETTQLINSFLGLIVFPQQYGNGIIDDTCVSSSLLEDIQKSIKCNTYTKDRKTDNLSNILYHLRNAIAHGSIKTKNNHNEVSDIIFTDTNKSQKFEIELSINLIKRFVTDFNAILHR